MIKLLSSLLALVERAFAFFDQERWKQQGRQDTIKDMNDELNRQIELGETADTISDPERDKRLRKRFDRAHTD